MYKHLVSLWFSFLFVSILIPSVSSASDLKGNGDPDIVVSDETMEIPDGFPTLNIGSALVGDPPITKTFTIENIGTEDLTIDEILVLTGKVGYSVTQQPMSPLAPGGSTTFTIELATTTADSFGATVSFSNNDPDESPYNFGIFGAVRNTPTIGLSPMMFELSVDEGNNMMTQTFELSNTTTQGSLPLEYSITDDADWLEVSSTSGTVVGGNSRDIDIIFDTENLTLGQYTGTITITDMNASNSPQELTVVLDVEGLDGPEIEVVQDAINITNAATIIDYGESEVGSDDVELIYTVSNIGTEDLILSNLNISGSAFSFTQIPSFTITPGSSSEFRIRLNQYTPVGTYFETISFDTNDSNENPFSFDLFGEMTAPDPAPDIVVEVNGVEIPNGNNDVPFDVGTVNVGEQGPSISVEIFNNGTGELKIDGLALPFGFDREGNFFNTVQPGASTGGDFVLNTDEARSVSGTVQFLNNDPEEPLFTFMLMGEVLAPASDLWITD